MHASNITLTNKDGSRTFRVRLNNDATAVVIETEGADMPFDREFVEIDYEDPAGRAAAAAATVIRASEFLDGVRLGRDRAGRHYAFLAIASIYRIPPTRNS